MKKVLLIPPLLFVMIVALASGKSPGRPAEPKCDCTCPTLDHMLKEKEAHDKEEQAELGRLRRQIFKDKLSSWPLP